ncbi:MAG: heavy metal-binding domain-containing protein, partial [Actinobacteria bacterium]|nr:heavy metal-binding domain-containing protein [Actinomycetota bacterium]
DIDILEPADLHEVVEEAVTAIEEPDAHILEPTDLHEVVEEAITAIEEPDIDILEPADLHEVVEEAITAIEEPDIDILEPTDQPEEPDTEILEPVMPEEISTLDASGSDEGTTTIESGSVKWGAGWQDAAQGWVQKEGGRSTWRPIITTTPEVGTWEIDTFLGIVAGEATLSDVEHDLPATRNRAIQSMVDQALSRGAHAVVGVRTEIQELGGIILVGAIGTAVTLKSPT